MVSNTQVFVQLHHYNKTIESNSDVFVQLYTNKHDIFLMQKARVTDVFSTSWCTVISLNICCSKLFTVERWQKKYWIFHNIEDVLFYGMYIMGRILCFSLMSCCWCSPVIILESTFTMSLRMWPWPLRQVSRSKSKRNHSYAPEMSGHSCSSRLV